MEFNDITDQLDFDAVAAAILATPRVHFTEDEFKECKRMVWALAENFAARDFEQFELGEVEKEITLIVPGPFLGYIDFAARIKGDCSLKPFKDYAGASVCFDWKTRQGELDTTWKNRLVLSWQWKIYSYRWGNKLFIYRGVNTEEQTREIIIEVPPSNTQEVEEYLDAAFAERAALIETGLLVWPRKMVPTGSPCYAFGRECPFISDCEEYSIPRQVPEPRRFSYSSLETFYLCRERYRRETLLKQEEGELEDTDSTARGKGVHSGIGEIYKQLRRLQQGEC